jgi:UDP-N-acetylmuramoyl-L-alanyl-D-glutamate--2,6-diaminopimelate ligase
MEFAAQAVAAGAVAVVTDSAGAEIAQNTEALSSGIELLVVPNPRAVAGAAISRLYGSPSQAMTTVGVTGTNGKTSVTHFLLDAWRSTEEFHDCALLGTLGAAVPMHLELQGATGFTTPEADLLQWQLASFRDHGVRAVAMEVSSHSLHLHRVDGTHFDVVIFTNLSQDHLDLHGTMDQYFLAKARLFAPQFSNHAVICVDDEWGQALVDRARVEGLVVTTYGFAPSDWHIQSTNEHSCEVAVAGELLTFPLPGPGDFTAANVVAAAAALHATGRSLPEVQNMLQSLRSVPGRMELVSSSSHDQPRVIVDYAHSPAAIETVLAAARPPSGRLIAVLGAGGDRDSSKRPLMGDAASAADIVVITDDNPRSENPSAIRDEIRNRVTAPVCEEIADRAEAIAWAVAAATHEDTVVILGKGAETGQTYGSTTVPFDDREQARRALALRSAQ